MNDRQKKILAHIIEEYTHTAIPVGSATLLEKYDLGVSSATVRNDMAELEENGFLYQPHVSSGRIPTDAGYRYFVEEVMDDRELSVSDQKKLQKELLKLKAQNVRLNRTVAKLLSGYSKNLAISGLVEKDEFYDFGIKGLLGEPEFKDVDEFCRVAEVLDYIDEKFDSIMEDLEGDETRIFIGKENPIGEISNCSMIISPYKSSEGRGILAIIGPKRMQYAKNKSLIEYVKKILGSSVVIIFVVNIIS